MTLLSRSFSDKLIQWQKYYGRHNLPWQINPTPYRVWISEVMLQQTQVTTAIPYYQNFMKKFPNLADLASASTESVLAAWSGLGYYRRAHFCLQSAQMVQKEHQGRMPEDADLLMQLPGIGKSTAHAILSLA
jgi:A/G-specific adenine glycosylase